MSLFLFLIVLLIGGTAATTAPPAVAKVPRLLEPVDVLFFQAFLLVPNPDKVSDLRNKLKEAMSKKSIPKDIDLSEYSDSPLFEKSISMGFKRYSFCNAMGVSASSPPREPSALVYYSANIFKCLNTEASSQEHFQKAKFLMEDCLFINHVLSSIDKPDDNLVHTAMTMISMSYRPTKILKVSSPVPIKLSSPKLSNILLPSPNLSLKIFADLLHKDDHTCTRIEEYFAENWGRYVGERASLVEEILIKEKMPAFEKGLRNILGTTKKFAVMCAADLALAKACNITGYLPFPNYRNPTELYLNIILQARMLLKFPDLRQANFQSLNMSFEKSIDAARYYLYFLPPTPTSVLIGKLDDHQNLLGKIPLAEAYYRSDFDYWRLALKKDGFPREILPPSNKLPHVQKNIIDCYTMETCIAPLVHEKANMTPLVEMLLPSITKYSKSYYSLSQFYIKSVYACRKQCPQYSPYFRRASGMPLSSRDLVLFEITIAQEMHYKNLTCLTPRIDYIEALLSYLHKRLDSETKDYVNKQIQLLKSS